ncbi:MAG: class I SAM-dependent rRNA methyltransferase [Halioglobus sp.]
MKDLFLRKGADHRLRGGHLWVYSNEVDSARSELGAFTAGDLVTVRNTNNKLLGSAYMEPHSLICARLYAPGEQRAMDQQWFTERLETALSLRQAAFDKPYYRLIYGDSDTLPGLIVDRFGDVLVMQLNCGGLERYREPLLAALLATLNPTGVLVRADSRSRREQGLPSESEVVFGEVAQEVPLEENGVHFLAPVCDGQKTGWFYDHRMSRARLAAWVSGKRVLDVYSYVGGWGVQAAAFGAEQVCCLDSSAQALEGVISNARLNAVNERVSTRRGSAPELMEAMYTQGERFDVLVLDPPAFVQRKKDLKKGIAAYRRINELGLQLLHPGGLLVSASCSMHLSRADLISCMQQAAVRSFCQIRVVEQGAQGPDHPIHPAIPETEYLKAVFARKL